MVINANLWPTFDYLWPESLGQPQLGQRVRLPFGRGNRKSLAFVVDIDRAGDAGGHTLKTVAEVIDPQSHFEPVLWKLAAWMSHYYMTPLGMVLAAMIPSAVGRHASRNETVAFLTSHHADWPATLGARQRTVLEELYVARKQGIEPLTLEALVAHAECGRETIQRLAGRNLIRLETRPVELPVLAEGAAANDPFELNEDQKKAMEELEGRLRVAGVSPACDAGVPPACVADILSASGRSMGVPSMSPTGVSPVSGSSPSFDSSLAEQQQQQQQRHGQDARETHGQDAHATTHADKMSAPQNSGFSVTLLHGVTGSGKTEVYVRAIRRVIAQGRQAILLVPEIALATQTLSRLLARLPRVAVLHSGLSDSQRAFYYDRIAQGQADVVVGPRSAIFAPTRKLGLVIVDEEHEPSYKQDTAPRYHGRDVAVMRGSLAGAAVILGSATPSLESLHNAQTGRYHLLTLPHRVRGLAMPKLQIVNLRREMTPGRIELLGRTLTLKMAAALDRREQIILLMNRRGYASYVFCPKCDWILECDHCTRAMVFHQATQLAMCHYCQHTAHLPECCPACRGKLLLFGFGIQRIEGELVRKFPGARTARMDSDTMTSPGQFQKIFEEFGAGEIDILLGTQMVGKGLDFPRVSLVGVVSADTSLTLPDFRAAERTFQLVVQVAGRAGRGQTPGEVVVQTLHEDEPAIRFAATHDYQGFAASELPLRREMGFPPYSRMVRMIVRHENVSKAAQDADRIGRSVAAVLPPQILMQGPMPCGVRKIRNLFRYQILLTAERAGWIQQFLSPRLGEFCRDLEAEVIADVDPIALL